MRVVVEAGRVAGAAELVALVPGVFKSKATINFPFLSYSVFLTSMISEDVDKMLTLGPAADSPPPPGSAGSPGCQWS